MWSSKDEDPAARAVRLPSFEDMLKEKKVALPSHGLVAQQPPRLQKESREHAVQRMCAEQLANTQTQCEQMLEDASRQAEEIARAAQHSSQEIYEQALKKAMLEAQEMSDEVKRMQIAEFSQCLAAFEKERTALFSHVRERLTGTVIDLASRIIFTELDRNDEVFRNIIESVMAYIESDTLHDINMSVEDYERYVAQDVSGHYERARRQGISLHPNKDMKHGDIAMIYDHGTIDASIDKQLRRAQYALEREG